MEKKSEQTYSTANNMIFLFKEIWGYNKRLMLHVLSAGVSEMLLPLGTLGLTAVVIDAVAESGDINSLMIMFALLLIIVLVFTMVSKTSMNILISQGNAFRITILNRLAMHLTSVDFDIFDGNQGQEKINKAFDTASSPEQVFQHIFILAEDAVKNILGFLLYSFILADIHWIFIVLIAISSIVNFRYSMFVNKKEDENKEFVSPINRKINYLRDKTGDFKQAKDMRLYKMEGWFGSVFTELSRQKYGYLEKILRKKFGGNVLNGFSTLLIDLVAYIFLIQQIINGQISVASFTIYFGAIATLSNWISGLLKNAVDLNKMALEIDDYREFMAIESRMNHGKGIEIDPEDTASYSIEFNDVSYRYPKAEKDTIKAFNVSIEAGEKIALVGVNGAGKSTLIKLLTGLYRPTEGEIKINGYSVDDYNIQDYFDLFSVVFQDYYELPVTIEEMIVQGKDKDAIRLETVSKQSGLKNIIEALPHKSQSKLVKRVYSDAVDLSGGQKQKLQLAKALYKKGSILVLDEPTAALDPIAESEIYNQYEELSKNKTSIFISHRLASTRFCDRILFLEDGRIIEEGSHTQLMEQKGKYCKMFETQSYYYKNEAGEDQYAVV
ncbi:MAG: ABC transporter ATP-binding protein [Alkalibacterium sp.]|nr:ABC transporter ATP-binding protein [Alkalibacterium sp.]